MYQLGALSMVLPVGRENLRILIKKIHVCVVTRVVLQIT